MKTTTSAAVIVERVYPVGAAGVRTAHRYISLSKSYHINEAYTKSELKWKTRYPEQIPLGTSVPNYAFLDVVTADGFNQVAAQADSSESSY